MFAIEFPLPSTTVAVMGEVEAPSFLMFWGFAVSLTDSTIVSSVIRTASNGIVWPKGVLVPFSSWNEPVNVRKLIHGIPTVKALGF